MVLQSLPKR